MKTKKTLKKVIMIMLSVIAALIVTILLIFNSYYSKLNIKERDDRIKSSAVNEFNKEKETLNSDELKSADEEIEKNLRDSATEVKFSDNVFNILLLGTDERETYPGTRTDSIILVSINKKTSEITLTSFMRDMYLNIPGYGNNRINAAFSLGGDDLVIKTIEENFKIKIDRYTRVGFDSFIEIIDSIGGVEDIDVSDEEMDVINWYVGEINELNGRPYELNSLKHSGKLKLNGIQALGYARIRKVGNNDFERTERQRRILKQLFKQAKDLNLVELNEMLNTILPYITTDLTRSEIVFLLLDFPKYSKPELRSNRIPCDNSYRDINVNGMSVLSVDFEKNIELIHNDLYEK